MTSTFKKMRVVHAVGTYLNISENWIYPQMYGVPGVASRAICRSLKNLEAFPLKNSAPIVDPPSRSNAFGIPWLFDRLARRLGRKGAIAGLRVRMWLPHIIHAHFGTRGWACIDLKNRLGVPLVTSFYGVDAWRLPTSEPVWRRRYEELFRVGDVFFVEGPAMRERLMELGCSAEKIRIQRIGVDLSTLPFENRSVSNGLDVMMIGRFVEKKGLTDGLKACGIARSRGANLRVTIIGDASDDNAAGQRLKEELQALANRPELHNRVRFAGYVSLEQTRSLLGRHNLFLCPSRHAANGDAEGGSPVALTEAMARGLGCVGTRHCDIPEVIIDGKTGYLCDEGDVSGMADILCMVSKNPDRLVDLTKAGRKHVEQEFSLQTQLARMRGLYESLLPAYGPVHS